MSVVLPNSPNPNTRKSTLAMAKLRLANNQFCLKLCGRIYHCMSLILNIQGSVNTGKLAERFFRVTQICLHRHQPFFDKFSLPMRRRSIGRRKH